MILNTKSGKYQIEVSNDGAVRLYRNNELWEDNPCYAKMLIEMVDEIELLRKIVEELS